MPFLRRHLRISDIAAWEARGDLKRLTAALLSREEVAARVAASDALGSLGDRQAVEPLITVLHDPERSLHISAARALGRLGDARSIPALVELALSDNGARAAAATALKLIDEGMATEQLVAALAGPDRKAAAEVLGWLGNVGAVEPLIDVLSGPERGDHWQWLYARDAAATALARIGDPRAVETLSRILRDEGHSVSVDFLAAVGKFGALAVEPLAVLLRTPGGWPDRHRLAHMLLNLGLPDDPATRAWYAVSVWDWQAAASLGDAAREPLADAVRAAAVYPERLPGTEIADALESLGLALDPRTKAWMSMARGRLYEVEAFGEAAIEPLLGVLARQGECRKWQDHQTAVEALGRMGDARALDQLISVLRRDEQLAVRESAARALGQIGDRRAVDALIESLRDVPSYPYSNNPYVTPDFTEKEWYEMTIGLHAAVREALVEIGDPRAAAALFQGRCFDPLQRLWSLHRNEPAQAACWQGVLDSVWTLVCEAFPLDWRYRRGKEQEEERARSLLEEIGAPAVALIGQRHAELDAEMNRRLPTGEGESTGDENPDFIPAGTWDWGFFSDVEGKLEGTLRAIGWRYGDAEFRALADSPEEGEHMRQLARKIMESL